MTNHCETESELYTIPCTSQLQSRHTAAAPLIPANASLCIGRRCTQDPSLSVPSRIDLLFIVFSALSSSRPNYTRHASDTTSTQNAVRLPIRERITGGAPWCFTTPESPGSPLWLFAVEADPLNHLRHIPRCAHNSQWTDDATKMEIFCCPSLQEATA